MKKLVVIIIVSISSLITSSISAKSSGGHQSHYSVEKLVNYELDGGYMTIEVNTKGCTGIDSFKVIAEDFDENSINIYRVKEDSCGMKPRIIELQYSIRHLGLDFDRAIKILNPVFK